MVSQNFTLSRSTLLTYFSVTARQEADALQEVAGNLCKPTTKGHEKEFTGLIYK